MLLGLSKIIDCPGESVPFSASIDLSDLRFGTSYPISESVEAEGTVRNTAGVLNEGYDPYLHPWHLRPLRIRL